MHLTRFTDLSLRVLMYLQVRDCDPPVTIAEVAEQFEAPHNHLIKVVNRLGKLGWVSATRGRNGGIRLACAPEFIRLGDLIRVLEEEPELIDCTDPPCPLHGSCLLKDFLQEALVAFYRQMNEYTLADVCERRTKAALTRLHIKAGRSIAF